MKSPSTALRTTLNTLLRGLDYEDAMDLDMDNLRVERFNNRNKNTDTEQQTRSKSDRQRQLQRHDRIAAKRTF